MSRNEEHQAELREFGLIGNQAIWLGELDGSTEVMADAAAIAGIIQKYERTSEAIGLFMYALQMSAADAAQMGPLTMRVIARQYEAVRKAMATAAPTVHELDDQLLNGIDAHEDQSQER